MKYLVTGGAGFIGSHLCEALLKRGGRVICLDNFNDYYSPERKRRNIAPFLTNSDFKLVEGDIRDANLISSLFAEERPDYVAHLAAMAGPRPSMEKPRLYENVNVGGTINLLAQSAKHEIRKFFLASTSSVYGRSPVPWSEISDTGSPLSPYAATKKTAEMFAGIYHAAHGLPVGIARFFTVYGPKGRPDMTPHVFADAMVNNRPIVLYQGGQDVYRDWTYIDDIMAGILALLDSEYEFEIFNLGNGKPTELIEFVRALEGITGIKAEIKSKPLPPADPPITFADITKAGRLLNFEPSTPLETGLTDFWQWYRNKDD